MAQVSQGNNQNNYNNNQINEDDNFINYEVDIEQSNGSLLSLVYEVETLPTMVFVTPEGDVLVKYAKTATAEEFIIIAQEAKEKFAEKEQ